MAAPSLVASTMHGPERGSGQRREHQRVLSNRLRDCLAAGDAAPDQVEHVRGVKPRTRRALGGAPVTAPDVGDAERLVRAGMGRDDLTSGGVDGLGTAAQSDRLGTVPDPGQRLGPGVEPAGDQQLTDLLLSPLRQRRQVQRRRLTEPRKQVRQDVMDRDTAPSAHRPRHPKGCATRPSAIPPRDTPGMGGPRSPAGGTMSRHGIAAAGTRQTKEPTADRCLIASCRCCGSSCQWPLAWCGEPTPGEVSHSSHVKLSATEKHGTAHRHNPALKLLSAVQDLLADMPVVSLRVAGVRHVSLASTDVAVTPRKRTRQDLIR